MVPVPEPPADLADHLLDNTLALVEIPSVSGEEAQIADYIEDLLKGIQPLNIERIGNNLIARTSLSKEFRLLIGGHTDTVPHPESFKGKKNTDSVSGSSISGPGAVDMKGGLAIMLEIARRLPDLDLSRDLLFDLSLVFYASEEVDLERNGLRHIEKSNADLLAADAGILMEPTGGAVEAGCQGSLKVQLFLKGTRAHTARAWKGENAIHRLGQVLYEVKNYVPRKPVIEGCEFHEALQTVYVNGGVAGNVVPDAADAVFNLRIAPDKTNAQALEEFKALAANALDQEVQVFSDIAEIKGDGIIVLDSVPPALPSLSHPLLTGLVNEVGNVRAKLGWTDVSFFYEKNIPALNFGPGDPELAHTQEEEVSGEELVFAYEKLSKAVLRY